MKKRSYEAQVLASRFRSQHGLSEIEPIRLKSLLLKLGVLTVFQPLSPGFSGMAIKKEGYRFMMVNAGHTLGRQHFTIGHELYHLFLQPDFESRICQTGKFQQQKDPTERMADHFAAHLLLPENGILSLLNPAELRKDEVHLESILKIEQYYSCSRAAVLWRLLELGLLPAGQAEGYKENIKLSARTRGYPTTLYEPSVERLEIIGDYGSVIKQLYDEDRISESHYLSLMADIGIEEEELFPAENSLDE
jgi:Zn-dependent peptidase ImmA (M78 family)